MVNFVLDCNYSGHLYDKKDYVQFKYPGHIYVCWVRLT